MAGDVKVACLIQRDLAYKAQEWGLVTRYSVILDALAHA